jgi:plastocyanin
MTYRALSLLVALAACGGGGDDPAADARPGPPDAQSSSVIMMSCTGVTPDATITTSGFAFSPADLTITVGQIVRFTPGGSHDMTGAGIATVTGQETCLEFTEAGTFEYICSVHPTMEGTVTVNP